MAFSNIQTGLLMHASLNPLHYKELVDLYMTGQAELQQQPDFIRNDFGHFVLHWP